MMSPQEEKDRKDLTAGDADKKEEAESLGPVNSEDNNRELMQSYKVSSFEEESSNHLISSPKPIVEKGGEHEFVKVSHLGSVQVKAVPTLSIAKMKSEKQAHSGRTKRRLTTTPEKVGSLSSRSSAITLRSGGSKGYIGGGDEEDFSPEQEGSPNNEPSPKVIVDIKKSPYEPGICAENGESLFEEMNALLQEHDDDDENSRAAQIFGPTNAGCLVKASGLIEKSGVLYSQTWNKGTIRGDPVGIIPNHLLLMVLVSNRFAKASELLLSGLCRDLEVYESVNRGLDDWGWSEDYVLVRATRKNYKFKANRRDCFKCAVFVARAHSCFLSFRKRKLKPRLISKLKTCLDMMETHIVAPSSNGCATSNSASTRRSISTTNIASHLSAKKRKKATPEYALSSSFSESHSAHSTSKSPSENAKNLHDPPTKRKRGRPPKNSKHQQTEDFSLIPPLSTGNDSIEQERETESSRSKRKRPPPNKRTDDVASSLASRQVSSSHPSLYELMSRFEDQYREMGQRYAEMGTLLREMKTAIDDRRTQSEQEIRRELLDEIQRNILENIPKR